MKEKETKFLVDSSYLKDESQYKGSAKKIYLPQSKNELIDFIIDSFNNKQSYTLQGARTGISGSAVPFTESIVSFEKLNKVLDFELCQEKLVNSLDAFACIKVEAGISLAEIEKEIQKLCANKSYKANNFEKNSTVNELIFPTCPTEHSATIGGIIAMGGNGPRGYYYGKIINYIKSMDICLIDGSCITLTKEDELFKLMNASEGMYATLLAATLYLVKKPNHCWGIAFFFSSDEQACQFTDLIDTYQKNKEKKELGANIISIEYIDDNTMQLVLNYQKNMDSILSLPQIPETAKAMIITEICADTEEEIMELAEVLMEYSTECMADAENSWAMSTEQEVRLLQNYRHAVAECVNMQMAKYTAKNEELCLLCSDIEYLNYDIDKMLAYYKENIKKYSLEAYIFGHIAKKHLYINILPKNQEEYTKGLNLIEELLTHAKKQKALLYKDHGIGKIKNQIIQKVLSKEEVTTFLKNKAKYDKDNLLNTKNGIINED